MTEWKCSGCGALSPDRVALCGCPTACLYRMTDGEIEQAVKRATYAFDSKCYDLASAFLEDEPNLFSDANCNELAALLQQTIEDFIADARRNYEPPDPPGFEAGFADNH